MGGTGGEGWGCWTDPISTSAPFTPEASGRISKSWLDSQPKGKSRSAGPFSLFLPGCQEQKVAEAIGGNKGKKKEKDVGLDARLMDRLLSMQGTKGPGFLWRLIFTSGLGQAHLTDGRRLDWGGLPDSPPPHPVL